LEILANPNAKTLYRLLIQRSEDEAWASRLMDAALKRYPDDLDLLKFASTILIHRSKPDLARAVQLARHAVELSQGKNGFLQAGLAEALKAQGDRAGAIAAAKEAIRLEPIPDHHALLSRCEAMKTGKEDSSKKPK
jgi:tetratricopeptide (TPR) repeat protein